MLCSRRRRHLYSDECRSRCVHVTSISSHHLRLKRQVGSPCPSLLSSSTFSMALGFALSPHAGVNAVCQSSGHLKRNRDKTPTPTLDIDAKRAKYVALPSPRVEEFSSQQQIYYSSPMQGPAVHFTTIDYNSPASTVEESPVSPKSGCSPATVATETTNSSVEASHDETPNTATDFLFNPSIDWPAATPFAAFPESPFSHPQAFSSTPNFGLLERHLGPPSSTNATFGSPVQHSPFQHQGEFSWCYCGACRAGQPHGFPHHRHASGGWRRPSSFTLPACYQNHVHTPCHDVYMAPLSAPLPPQ